VHPPKPKRGRIVSHEFPAWGPLFKLAPELVGEFTWAHEVELEDGIRLQAYRHRQTRRYLHLDHSGRAFAFIWKEGKERRYKEVDPRRLLEIVLAKPEEAVSLLRQNVSSEFKTLRWARSATKHRISRKRSRYVIENSFAVLKESPPVWHPTATDERLVFLGDDPNGIALEVIAVEPESGSLHVIHAMKLRPRFKFAYQEVKRWRR